MVKVGGSIWLLVVSFVGWFLWKVLLMVKLLLLLLVIGVLIGVGENIVNEFFGKG